MKRRRSVLVDERVGILHRVHFGDGEPEVRQLVGDESDDRNAFVRACARQVRPVDCGEAVASEPLSGGETPTYSWCRVVVGDIRVFFGADPIESITLTRYGP